MTAKHREEQRTLKKKATLAWLSGDHAVVEATHAKIEQSKIREENADNALLAIDAIADNIAAHWRTSEGELTEAADNALATAQWAEKMIMDDAPYSYDSYEEMIKDQAMCVKQEIFEIVYNGLRK